MLLIKSSLKGFFSQSHFSRYHQSDRQFGPRPGRTSVDLGADDTGGQILIRFS